MATPARSLLDIKKRSAKDVVGPLKADNARDSVDNAKKLTREAASYGLRMSEYLDLAIEPVRDEKGTVVLRGSELALAELNLPFRNDFTNGVCLEAASETFNTYPGTRAMFPEVIDQMVQWANRQDQYERVEDVVGTSRTVSGVVLLSTVVDDDSGDRDSFTVPEAGRIPVRKISTSQKTVTFYKHGSSLRWSYEFERRANLDILTPYASRIARELERSKLTAAVNTIINGDGVQPAATEVNQSTYNAAVTAAGGSNATNGKVSWQHFLYWLVQRAKAGVPVDTVIGNWDSAFNWLNLMSVPTANQGPTSVETLAKALGVSPEAAGVSTFQRMNIPLPTFAIASAAPASKLIGITKGETLEELKEAGSDISENERAIENQTVTVTKTENTGYRIVWPDTRSVFDYSE